MNLNEVALNSREAVLSYAGDDYDKLVAPFRDFLKISVSKLDDILDSVNDNMATFGFTEKLGISLNGEDGRYAFALKTALEDERFARESHPLFLAAYADLTNL